MAIADRERTTAENREPEPWDGFEHQFIAGEWRAGGAGGANRDSDPYTQKTLVEIPLAGRDDLDAAYGADLANQPFGGAKNSGIGRFGGDWAIAAFTTDHWITVQHEPRQYPRSAAGVLGPGTGG